MTWVRDRDNDGWRAGCTVLLLVALVLGVVILVDGGWTWDDLAWAGFVAITLWELLVTALSGVFVGDREAVWITLGGIHRVQLDQVEAVEVTRPARLVRLWVWAEGRRHGVIDVGYWTSAVAARHVALQLTRELQRRGATAGLYDAIADDWPIVPVAGPPGRADHGLEASADTDA